MTVPRPSPSTYAAAPRGTTTGTPGEVRATSRSDRRCRWSACACEIDDQVGAAHVGVRETAACGAGVPAAG